MKEVYSIRRRKAQFCLVLCFLIFIYFNSSLKAQNVAVTDNESYSANPSAMLDVYSTNKGMLVPRLDSAQRVSINSPATGLLVFDTSLNGFMYYNGSSWKAISQMNAGVGDGQALFAVVNNAGDTVFAVYNDGVKVTVDEGLKGKVGGFAVSGRTPAKAGQEEINYFHVTPDSTRIYINDTSSTKGTVGGFAVSGRTPAKAGELDYLRVTPDNTSIYVNEDSTKGTVGGFAVSGRTPAKTQLHNYFVSTMDSTRIYISDSSMIKGTVGGFAVSGRTPAKGIMSDFFNISANTDVDIVNNESRIMWYPTKAALLAGEVHVGSSDSVGTNSLAMGYRAISKGDYSQAMGFKTFSEGNFSQALGNSAKATGLNSTAIGNYALSSAKNSFAMGDSAIARGIGSYAFGSTGLDTTTGKPTNVQTIANGDYSFAFGFGSYAQKVGSVAIGTSAAAMGKFSMAFGLNDTTSGPYSFALGAYNKATGPASYAIGNGCVAIGGSSFAIGLQDTASALFSFAMGFNTNASNTLATSFGAGTVASGYASTAFGHLTQATDWYATSFGASTIASGHTSTAFGNNTTASGQYSVAMGNKIIVSGHNSVGIGLNDTQYTVTQNNTMAIMGGIVGIGTTTPDAQLKVGFGGFAIGSEAATNNLYGFGRTIQLATQTGINGGGTYDNHTGALIWSTLESGWGDARLRIALASEWETYNTTTPALIIGQNFLDGATLAFRTGNIERLRIDASGNVGIGTSPAYKLDVAGPINISKGWSESIALSINGVEAIWSNGNRYSWGYGGTYNYFDDVVGIGTTDATATKLNIVGSAPVVRILMNELDRTGQLIRFADYLGDVGNITTTNGLISYNTFTGSHYAMIKDEVIMGMLVASNGINKYQHNDPNSEIIYGAIVSSEPNSKNIIGAFLDKTDTEYNDSVDLVMAVGNGVIWVVDNGENLEFGDYLISSSIPGHAMKDNGEFDVLNVIARAAEPLDWNAETQTINGVKHKLISVFFENFIIDKTNHKLRSEVDKLNVENSKLKNDLMEIRKEVESMKTLLKSNQK